MKIYNSMTRKKEEFKPIEDGKVKMYACGITVYDLSHIGHARQAIVYSMIAEYLRFRGYEVKYVRNYTDVDDKIINRANMLGKNALEFSKEQIIETEKDMEALHVKDADVKPKASENIDNIIKFVQGLIDKGYAYSTDNGDVYYIVRKFEGYGKLSNRKIDELLNGVRKDVDEAKRDPLDFALWKAAKPNEIYWDSPWEKGRPGWHIECSTMALNELGETIDIHGGGKDLIFPHHENEIAQSEALNGKEFAKYWSHCGLIKINGEKMSKSLGNSLTIRDALKKYNFEVIKFVFLQKHYTSDIDILDKDFLDSEKHLYYFYNTIKDAKIFIENHKGQNNNILLDDDISSEIEKNFILSMDDDFNTPIVISDLYSYFKYINSKLKDINKSNYEITANTLNNILNKIISLYGILGLFTQDSDVFINELKNKYLKELNISEEDINLKIKNREIAKENKDFYTADSIRDELLNLGIVLKDTRNKTYWDLKKLYNLD
jgi:cysteinyl-tRNA synthetase